MKYVQCTWGEKLAWDSETHIHIFFLAARRLCVDVERLLHFLPALILSDPLEMDCASTHHANLISILDRDVFGTFNLHHSFRKM